MSEGRPHLYVNSKGYQVTRHSYSGGDTFNDCARKYYLERVQGWTDKQERSSKFFGIALEAAITYWHRNRQNTDAACAEFKRLWAEHKDKPYLYNKTDVSWETLFYDGMELVQLYAIRYPEFPYIVNNLDDFQVETTFELFPGTKLAGIEFTSYIDLVAQMKEGFEPIIIDMKTSGKDVPEYTVLDPQLRSYAWVKGWSNVAFLWFRKCGRSVKKGDTVFLLKPVSGSKAGDECIVMSKEILGGIWVTQNQRVVDELDAKFVGSSKAVEAERSAYIRANCFLVNDGAYTKQRVQFKQAVITEESQVDIGRSIKKDVINIVNATEKEFFPMQSGVRFPHEKCPMCSMRGICSGNAELRDMLVVRKQVNELDFGNDAE
jgi:hypothetical protein